MDEYWVCQHCRSLNRAGSGKCYSCHQKLGSRPKAAAVSTPVRASSAAPGPAGPPPPYLARPGAEPVADFSAAAHQAPAVGSSRGLLRRPHPTNPIRRRIARALAARPYVPIWRLGYVTAGLLLLLLLDGLALVGLGAPVAVRALRAASLDHVPADLGGGLGAALLALGVAFVVLGAICLLCFSVFVALTTHNTPGLGAEMPLLTPYRAGTCWLHDIWTQVRIGFALIAPVVLFWLGLGIVGGVLAIVCLEIAQRRLDDPFGWLNQPHRHLSDLYVRLGLQGGRSPVATAWSACFRAANIVALVGWAFPLGLLLSQGIAVLSHRPALVATVASGWGTGQAAVAILAGTLLLWIAGSIGLLLPITITLAQRQRTRRLLVLAGRTRPWGARPGPTYVVDPAYMSPGPADDRFEGRTLDRDQASLYSPSTTSSFWSGEPSEELPG